MLDLGNLPLFPVAGRQLANAQPIANVLTDDVPIGYLEHAMAAVLMAEPLLRDITACLHNCGLKYGVLGGWVRDQLFNMERTSLSAAPRDIDLVVADTTHAMLSELLPRPSARTIFGGFTYHGANVDIDLWGANDTFLTHRLGLPSDLAHVLAVTDFNINAIIFLPAQFEQPSTVLDGGAIDSLATRTISFHFEQIALPLAQVARLLSFSVKLGFQFDADVTSFINAHCESGIARDAVHRDLAGRYTVEHVDAAMLLLKSILIEGRK